MIEIKKNGVSQNNSVTPSLHSALENAGYYCKPELAVSVQLAIQNKPVAGAILQGSTGSGKTYLPESLSKALGYELMYFQCQVHTDETDLIQKMIPDETTVSGIKLQDNILLNAIKKSATGKVILCIDEYDKSRPSADTVMLEFLQRGGIWHNNIDYQGNLDNLIIFLCCNEERELSDFIKRRLPHIYFDKIAPEVVSRVLSQVKAKQKYIRLATALYNVTYEKFPKVITVQELTQFITACNYSENYKMLAYQFLIKNQDLVSQFEKILQEKNIDLFSPPEVVSDIPSELESLNPEGKKDIYAKFLKKADKEFKKFKSPSHPYDLTGVIEVDLSEKIFPIVFEYTPRTYHELLNDYQNKTKGVLLDYNTKLTLVRYQEDYYIVSDIHDASGTLTGNPEIKALMERLFVTKVSSDGQIILRYYCDNLAFNEKIKTRNSLDPLILYSSDKEVIFNLFATSNLPIECRYDVQEDAVEVVVQYKKGICLNKYYQDFYHTDTNFNIIV